MSIEEFVKVEIIKFKECKWEHLSQKFCTEISQSSLSKNLDICIRKKQVSDDLSVCMVNLLL